MGSPIEGVKLGWGKVKLLLDEEIMVHLARKESRKGLKKGKRAAKGSKGEGSNFKATAVGAVVRWKSTAGDQRLFRFCAFLLKSSMKQKGELRKL